MPAPLTIGDCRRILSVRRWSIGDVLNRDDAGQEVWTAYAMRGDFGTFAHHASQVEAWRQLVQLVRGGRN